MHALFINKSAKISTIYMIIDDRSKGMNIQIVLSTNKCFFSGGILLADVLFISEVIQNCDISV